MVLGLTRSMRKWRRERSLGLRAFMNALSKSPDWRLASTSFLASFVGFRERMSVE